MKQRFLMMALGVLVVLGMPMTAFSQEPDVILDALADLSERVGKTLSLDDLASWQEAVSLALPALPDPANAAVVEFEAGAAGRPDRYLITVAWQEPGARGAEEYRYTSELVIMERPPI